MNSSRNPRPLAWSILVAAAVIVVAAGCASRPVLDTKQLKPWIADDEWLGMIEVVEGTYPRYSWRYYRDNCRGDAASETAESCLARIEGRQENSDRFAPTYAIDFAHDDGELIERRIIGGFDRLETPSACRVTRYAHSDDSFVATCVDPSSGAESLRRDGVGSVRVSRREGRTHIEYFDREGNATASGSGAAAIEIRYASGAPVEIRHLDTGGKLTDAQFHGARGALVRYEELSGVGGKKFVAEHLLGADGSTRRSNFWETAPVAPALCEVGLDRDGRALLPERCVGLHETVTVSSEPEILFGDSQQVE